MLNQIRVGELDYDDIDNEQLLKTRFISKTDQNYPSDATHSFAENAPADKYNNVMLDKLQGIKYEIYAPDELPKNIFELGTSTVQTEQSVFHPRKEN
jgi:hypothetical protein